MGCWCSRSSRNKKKYIYIYIYVIFPREQDGSSALCTSLQRCIFDPKPERQLQTVVILNTEMKYDTLDWRPEQKLSNGVT